MSDWERDDRRRRLDEFAKAALSGILGARNGFLVDVGVENVAGWAYDCAEKMLAESDRRAKEGTK